MDKKNIFILFVFFSLICSISVVSAHEGMENPIVTFDELTPGEEVSDDVNFKLEVHEHNEVKHVNIIAEHIETRTKYLDKEDLNPQDGWGVIWDTSNAPNGEYWITATAYDVKGLEGKAEMKIILNNIPRESSIVLDTSTTVVNKSTNLVASLKDINSNPISDKSIDFIIDGKTYSSKTTSSGVATVSFTPNEIKNYEIIVKFSGDNKYLESQTEGLLKVMSNINATIININDIVGNNKERILFKANLICPGLYDASLNKKIDFYVNGNLVGSNFTNLTGDAIFYYTISETGGSHIYSVRYRNESGDNFTDNAILYVPQSELYMTMSAVTYSRDGIFTVGNTFKLSLTVHNNGPDSAQNTIVKYAVPSSLKFIESIASCGKTTFSSNTLIWDMGDVPVGNQQIDILFSILSAGRISLSPSITTITYDESVDNAVPTRFLTVNSYKLKSEGLVKYYGGSEKYRAYLYSSNGQPVSGATFKITINKQTIYLKTNNKGFVELDVNLKAGKYTITVKCNSLSISNKITIKSVLITKNLSKKKSKKIKFTAKLLNKNGKIVKNKKITFKLKGKKYFAKTNKKGIATVSFKNLKVGKYVVQTSYGKSTVKNTIKINK